MDRTEWDSRYSASDLVWGAEPNQFVVEQFTGLSAGRALDLAAGEGRNALWLAGQGWRVTAVDFSAVAAERGAALAARQGVTVEWTVADLRDYLPQPGSFDAVLIAYLHLPAEVRSGVLARAAGALVPGGRVVVIGHDLNNLTEGIGGPQDPSVLYTPESIVADLPGLTVRRADRVRRRVSAGPDRGEPGEAVDTLVVAVRA